MQFLHVVSQIIGYISIGILVFGSAQAFILFLQNDFQTNLENVLPFLVTDRIINSVKEFIPISYKPNVMNNRTYNSKLC